MDFYPANGVSGTCDANPNNLKPVNGIISVNIKIDINDNECQTD